MRRDDLIYIAGLFDGEGSVGVYANRPSTKGNGGGHCLRAQLVQNENPFSEKLWDKLQEAFGGKVGRSRSQSGRWKLNWQVNGNLAAAFLRQIQPWLRLKYTQAHVAIKWQTTRPAPARRANGTFLPFNARQRKLDHQVALSLRRLKREGAA